MATPQATTKNVRLVPARTDDEPAFTDRFQDYLAELAQFTGSRPNRRGLYEYHGYERYWHDRRRHPFFIEAAGRRAGLLLLRELPARESDHAARSLQVAEICVFRPHRRRGVARATIRLAAAMAERNGLPLTWSAYMSNAPAVALYESVLDEFRSQPRPWTVERRRGIDRSGLARYYYRMDPPEGTPRSRPGERADGPDPP
ncbi:MAG: GNAT family N-acetyltransferase [Planctomycetota bacterium]